MSETAEAYWATAPFEGRIEPVTIDAATPDSVLVRTLYSGISRGTESLVASGAVPQSQHQLMRCPFQSGEFSFPVKYGYANVGLVEEGPNDLVGRNVFCLFPHQTRYRVPRSAVTPLPEMLPPGRAVLAANLETALNGIWDSGITAGDRIYVFGAGVVGLLTAWIANRIPGTDVTLLDIDQKRAVAAKALDLRFGLPGQVAGEADAIIDCSGAPAALARALDLAGFEAVITVMSWFGMSQVPLALGEAFHSKRLQLRSSQVGRVATRQRSRWPHGRRMAKALQLLEAPGLDALISGESPFRALPDVLGDIARGQRDTLCHRIRYDQETAIGG